MNDINDLSVRSLVNYINAGNFSIVDFDRVVRKLLKWKDIAGFGECPVIKDKCGISQASCDYLLSARQCVLIAATMNLRIQSYVINRILELNKTYEKIDYITPDWGVTDVYNLHTLLVGDYSLSQSFFDMETRIDSLFKCEEFGESIGYAKVIVPFNGANYERDVRLLTPKQAMIAAGQVSMEAQMYIIDILHLLEVKYEPHNVLQEKLPEAMRKLEAYTNHQILPHNGKGSIEEFDENGTRFYFEEGFYINTIFLNIHPLDGVKVFQVEEES